MAMDKDTWIAENLFPKQDNVRRPRLNVKSVDVFTATRKTKITLCVLGSWAIYMPPYNIARLAGLTREAGYHTKVYDFNVESHYLLKAANSDLDDAWNGANYWWWQEPDYYKRIHPTYEPILKNYLEILLADEPDIIGFSTYYTNILATTWMVTEIKKRRPDITIVFGGPQCHEGNFVKPKDVSYVFVGESEQNILDFLNNWEDGVKPSNDFIGGLYSDTRIDIDSLPYPDYSDFDLDKYWGKGSICAEISRGCIAKCSYCTEVYYWKFRDRGALTVVDELEFQVNRYGITFVSFVDSLMNGNLKEFRRFCEELIERDLKINWWGYARCDGRMDFEYYQLMADAGCQGFNYGIETGSDKVLKLINKKNTVAEINQNLIDSHKVGMKVSACWVIGAPGEDIEAFTHSFNMLWNHRARIYAVSPGPGLGDNHGSDYDNREKYNLNPRATPWLGGWFTNDLTNTRLHRQIRIKLMHIWLYVCKEYGGTLTNVHSVGNITDHFNLTFDSEYINNHVEYEDFDFNIVQSGHGTFADSVMNEVFGFFRMLWRVKGGFEMTLNFNKELDHKDFIFAITPDTHSYESTHWFKIDDDGNFQTKSTHHFVNNYKNVVSTDGFSYTHEATGTWTESKKTKVKRVFFIKQSPTDRMRIPLEGCLAPISVDERLFLARVVKRLPAQAVVIETDAGMGGRTSVIAHANKDISIFVEEGFNQSLKEEFERMPWIREQMLDVGKEAGVDNKQDIYDLYNSIIDDLNVDPSGKQLLTRIATTYNNIHINDPDVVNKTWGTHVDLCLINLVSKDKLAQDISYWSGKVKENGYMVAHPYNRELSNEIVDEYDKLVQAGWTVVEKKDNMILIQKPKL